MDKKRVLIVCCLFLFAVAVAFAGSSNTMGGVFLTWTDGGQAAIFATNTNSGTVSISFTVYYNDGTSSKFDDRVYGGVSGVLLVGAHNASGIKRIALTRVR